MKRDIKFATVAGAAFLVAGLALAQFPAKHPDGVEMPMPGTLSGPVDEKSVQVPGGGPVAVGQGMLQVQCPDGLTCSGTGLPKVALIKSTEQSVAPPSGGIIQLSAFGWLEPYVDSVVQALLLAGLSWLAKSKYTQWMDQSARDALATFTKNTASSLIADGFVRMEGKSIAVSSAALATEVSTAADRIPGAMKRFGLTPGAVAQKIVDAIPQTPAGAAIVATAHAPPDDPKLVDPVTPITLKAAGNNDNPPTSSS